MDYSQAISNLNQKVINQLKTAIELGRWESGDKLTPEQVESAMQAVMLWEAKNIGNAEGQPFVIGRQGELSTGKGGIYESRSKPVVSDEKIIIKNKV